MDRGEPGDVREEESRSERFGDLSLVLKGTDGQGVQPSPQLEIDTPDLGTGDHVPLLSRKVQVRQDLVQL
jgi:hypothetical protein